MKKILAIFFTLVLSWATSPANASEFGELKTQFSAARTSLVAMVFYKDQRGPAQQKIVKDTADAVSAKLAKMKAPVGKEGKFMDLVETWNAFKETRENELVPAILRGEEETVKKIVWGIQKERFTKCMSLIRELDSNEKGSSAYQSDHNELLLRLTEARMSLLNMMRHKDKRGPAEQKLVKDTADAVSIQLADMKAPAGKEAQFKELVDTWKAFKETREKELVPAILNGNDDAAQKIAHGIQKERLSKILSLTKELDNHRFALPSANAGEIEEFRAKLNAARDSLVEMLLHKYKRGAEQQKLVKNTADAVSAQLEKMNATGGKEVQFNELVKTWKAFKETREKEVVPAILGGNDEEARIITFGIQQERLQKCVFLAGQLDN